MLSPQNKNQLAPVTGGGLMSSYLPMAVSFDDGSKQGKVGEKPRHSMTGS
jgi:hypothetical protein